MPAVLVQCLSGRLDTVITLRGEKNWPRLLEERSSPKKENRRQENTRTYAAMNNTLAVLTVHVASQVSAHTVCKSLCHLSTFQQDRLKGDSHTPFLPPTFFFLSVPLSLSFSLLCVFVLDDQAVGWSV